MATLLRILITATAICFFGSFSVAQKKVKVKYPPPILSDAYPSFIDACQISEHKKGIIYTRFIYSGVEEYWGLSHPDEKCELNVYLDIPYDVELTRNQKRSFKDLHHQYWKYCLVIDVIGKYEDEDKEGYGHLGTNKGKFTVSKIISIRLLPKKRS